MIFSLQETIAAPREFVWHYLTDPDHMALWMSGVDNIRTADGNPMASGTKIIFKARNKERRARIVEFEPMQRMALRSVQGPVTADYVYQLAEAENDQQTVAKLTAHCTTGGWIRIFTPLLKSAIRRADGKQMIDLKAVVQGAKPTNHI